MSGTTGGTIRSAAFCSAATSCSQSAEEIVNIEEVGRGGDEDSDVTSPAESLVPLRAVGGEVEEIPAETPDDVSVQLVEQLVGALELADALQLRGDHNSG